VKTIDAALLFGAGIPLLAAILGVAAGKGRFARDRFPTGGAKIAALGLLFLVLVTTILLPSTGSSASLDTSRLSYSGIFVVQGVLASFLACWWLLSGRPHLADFLALRSPRPLAEAGLGICLGLIGWVLTLAVGLLFGLVTLWLDLPRPTAVPPLVQWMAALSPFRKLLIVLCAMTLEEFYFRAFLQRRFGPVSASILFLLAHGGYGEPFFFVGLIAITAVLAVAFQKTGSTWAPVFAHGTFDAVQLFIFLPVATKLLSGS
jgi:membrane protease YdiL (CAAX protease family)